MKTAEFQERMHRRNADLTLPRGRAYIASVVRSVGTVDAEENP